MLRIGREVSRVGIVAGRGRELSRGHRRDKLRVCEIVTIELSGLCIRSVAEAVQVDAGPELTIRLPVEDQPPGLQILVPQGVVAGFAPLPSSAMVEAKRQAGRKGLGDRAAHKTIAMAGIEAAIGGFHPDGKARGGMSRIEVDGPAGRVLAEQGALRTLEDFHVVEIKESAFG